MIITIDTSKKTMVKVLDGKSETLPLYSKEAYELITEQWLKVGWNEKYSYTFTWLGRPIIQLPEDLVRIQEVIYRLKPDVIVETGVAHGGSLILYASLMRSVGKGRVLGIDIEIKPHNRKAIETHELAEYITLIEGSSTDPAVIQKVRSLIKPGETVMVVLDSNHSKRHVFEELEQYHSLVTPGSYIVATDGIMKDLCDVPSGKDSWAQDNPCEAAREFLKIHPEFALEPPAWSFNESKLDASITYWPDSWLKKRA